MPKKNTKLQKGNKDTFKTAWDFSNLYSSIKDPRISEDVSKIVKAYTDFSKKYSSNDNFTKTEENLLSALKDWEKLGVDTMSWKPIWYLHHMGSLNSTDDQVKAAKNKLNAQLVEAANQIVFFTLRIGSIDKKTQKQYLSSRILSPYKYFLTTIFNNAKHKLSESEERILNLKHTVSYSMWVDAQKKVMGQAEVIWKKKRMPLTTAISIKTNLPLKERRALHQIVVEKIREISFMAEAELVAVITNKKIDDELRVFSLPYESTVLEYQNDISTVQALVEAVSSEYRISQDFFELKRKMLGLDKITVADFATEIAKVQKKVPFEKAVEIISSSFREAGDFFDNLFQQMLKEGRIDVFPKAGKRTGAYCSSGTGVPTVIFMNYSDDINSVSTLAHEMGHAIHGELSKTQPPIYEDYTISVAEVASTFFEALVFDSMQKELSGKELIYARMRQVQDDIFTIFRQIGFFNYELALHKYVRENGYMPKEVMAQEYANMTKKFIGKAGDIKENDGYLFTSVPHFRYFFYVYSYAFGQLISKALYTRYKKDPSYMTQIKKFLSAGGSMSPADIFKAIDIDVTDPKFFIDGLSSIKKELKEIEKLAKKEKMIK